MKFSGQKSLAERFKNSGGLGLNFPRAEAHGRGCLTAMDTDPGVLGQGGGWKAERRGSGSVWARRNRQRNERNGRKERQGIGTDAPSPRMQCPSASGAL